MKRGCIKSSHKCGIIFKGISYIMLGARQFCAKVAKQHFFEANTPDYGYKPMRIGYGIITKLGHTWL